MESLAYAMRKNNGFDLIIVTISTMPFLLAGWSDTKEKPTVSKQDTHKARQIPIVKFHAGVSEACGQQCKNANQVSVT